MFIDISPLKNNRDYRYLYFGQFVSFFGTMLSVVTIPYQIYQITHSTLMVGLLGAVELIPLLITAFIGGALADVLERRKILLFSELGMAACCLILIINTLLPTPSIALIFIIGALLSALSGFHRPSLDAMSPRLVSHHEIQALSSLNALKSTIGTIGGPAVAGILIASVGVTWTYVIDLMTFVVSVIALFNIKNNEQLSNEVTPTLQSIKEGIRYAIKRQEILGTYLVDFAAMIFAWPNALFPAIALSYGNTKALGWLYSAPAIGALIVTIFSGWTAKVHRHGLAVICAAVCWGIAIIGFGSFNYLPVILVFLGLAGAADCVSGIFRSTIWNETIPDKLRGRMAGLEMISYMSGPLLGNAWAGFYSSMTSVQIAIVTGGSLCIVGVVTFALFLPKLVKYNNQNALIDNTH